MLVAIARDDQTDTLLHTCGREESHEKTRAYVISSGDIDRTTYAYYIGRNEEFKNTEDGEEHIKEDGQAV